MILPKKHLIVALFVLLSIVGKSQTNETDSICFNDKLASLNYAALNCLNWVAVNYAFDSNRIELAAITEETIDMMFARKLSLRRAANVRDYLIAMGVKEKDISIYEVLPEHFETDLADYQANSFIRLIKN
jgi:hypothetical protein